MFIMLGASCLFEGYDSLNSLSAACIVLIALSPLCVYAPGFQLSFAACFGIVLLAGCSGVISRPERANGYGPGNYFRSNRHFALADKYVS